MRAPVELRPHTSSIRTYLLAVIAIAAVVATATLLLRSGSEPQPVAADSVAAPASAPSAAAYIKFDGIDGESKDSNHDTWIDVLSISHGITRSISTETSGTARQRASATLGDIVVVKEIDKSSPKLQEALVNGQTIPSLIIDLTNSSSTSRSEPYLKYELTNVQMTNYRVTALADERERPTETISINFEEIKVTYTEVDENTGASKGDIEYTWNVLQGTQ